MVEFPGFPACVGDLRDDCDDGVTGTFSLAAVVIVEEQVELMPFTTRRGGNRPSGVLSVLAVGLKPPTTSLTARA